MKANKQSKIKVFRVKKSNIALYSINRINLPNLLSRKDDLLCYLNREAVTGLWYSYPRAALRVRKLIDYISTNASVLSRKFIFRKEHVNV